MVDNKHGALLDIESKEDFAYYLERPIKDLTMLAYAKNGIRYKTFEIGKKRSGEKRTIEAPVGYLKAVQRQLLELFNEAYRPPQCVHGFVSSCSIASNAMSHVKKSAVVNLDLRDFFPSITGDRIHGLFRKDPFSFPEDVANLLTELVCYKGSLPQGAPTSPILSNMICYRLDKQLVSYAAKNKLVYTRYADDITFSSTSRSAINKLFNESELGINSVSPEVRNIIGSNRFEINETKIHIARKSSRQQVTGIIVNEKCNFPRKEYRSLRVLFNNWALVGFEYAGAEYAKRNHSYSSKLFNEAGLISETLLKKHIRGRLEYYTMITGPNKKASQPLAKLWNMYHDVTGEKVPISTPERTVCQTEICYSRQNDQGDPIPLCENGTSFLTDKGYLFTCAHCLCDIHHEYKKIGDERCSFPTLKVLYEPELSDFLIDKTLDVAAIKAPPFMKNEAFALTNGNYFPQIGESVKAYGFAGGDSSIRCIEAAVAETLKAGRVRVDRPFIHGMSGGPVFNTRGEAIGLLTGGSAPDDYSHDGEFVLFSAISEQLPNAFR
ncbi:reverse transcriptase domain-containing protein [Paraeggerthella hongkongensis]|uniref:RNA-directed DNA polymerase n=1 Tax=Paraeggerthella hongkongensis TaxID=230658 RepID=A0A3N0AT12_9ACTN|nr:reverse transcriptase domain-containing protein [Paraeggerthella hongkongensis]RNL38027.1 hypothetical protein DMP08_12100 [Paraeggerthella hongkongensis]